MWQLDAAALNLIAILLYYSPKTSIAMFLCPSYIAVCFLSCACILFSAMLVAAYTGLTCNICTESVVQILQNLLEGWT